MFIRRLGLAEGHLPGAAHLIQLAYLRLRGFVLAVMGCVLCLTAMGAEELRVWHPMPVCFVEPTPDGDSTKQCLEFLDEHWFPPKEIFFAQDLMSLACIVLSLALAFISFALWILFYNARPKNTLLNFFWVGGVLNVLPSFTILIPLLWNMHSLLANEEIKFPTDFRLPALPYEETLGLSIYGLVLISISKPKSRRCP
uniref:Uncharacterized protein n=1 Tax=Anolis carolinensis TaxID=28377 RepID=A0A803SLT7_ANOCA